MAEVLGQIGMGNLMKVIPQNKLFAISEFLLAAENQMLAELQRLLALAGG